MASSVHSEPAAEEESDNEDQVNNKEDEETDDASEHEDQVNYKDPDSGFRRPITIRTI